MSKRRREDKRGKTGRALFAVIVIGLLIGILGSCGRFGGGGEAGKGADGSTAGGPGAGTAEEQTVFAVSTTEAVLGQIRDYIEVNGDVISKTTVQTFPDTAGKLSRIYVDLGDRVRKDQVIAEVDPSKPGMKYESSPVKAPITGTVTDLPAQEGSTVGPQMSVAQISKMDTLQVRTDIAERFISDMEVGLEWTWISSFPETYSWGRQEIQMTASNGSPSSLIRSTHRSAVA